MTSATLWAEISDLIVRNQVTPLADRLVALTEAERGEIGARLPGLVKELRRRVVEQARADSPGDFEELESWEVDGLLDDRAGALVLAGVGCVTGPAAAVTWMTSRDVNRRWADELDVAPVVRVAAARPEAWRLDVAVRLARRIRRPADRFAPLAVALLRDSGATPPDHDPLVAAWLTAPSVAADPLSPLLLPRVFDADGAGRALRDERLDPRPTRWLAAAARDLPRDQALDGCVSRFLRGGDVQDLRFFVRLHQLLAPTAEESASRLRDYLRLLPSAPGTVAEVAAGQVRQAMPLDHADLVEAVEALTFRAEAKMAATGLRWLDQSVKSAPESAGDFLTALTTAYAHSSFDVRNRAAELTLKHAGPFAAHAETILDALPHLGADLGAKVAARFGGETPAGDLTDAKEFPPLPDVPETGRFPEPSLSPDDDVRWVGRERWLAAFVAGAADDRSKVRDELKAQLEQGPYYWRSIETRTDLDLWQLALADELVNPGPGGLPDLPKREPQTVWINCADSHVLRRVTRGEPVPRETAPVPKRSAQRPDYVYADEVIPRSVVITWTTDEGPVKAVAVENGRQLSVVGGVVMVPPGEPTGAAYRPDAHGHAPKDLDHIARELLRLGVNAERVEAMRLLRQVPPPGPDEPLVAVTVFLTPGHSRVLQPEPLHPAEEWRRRHRLPFPDAVPPPLQFLIHRYHELLTALRSGALPPVLLATPTWLDGHLDPDVLVARLELCAAAGVEPLPSDLAQALLRLPRSGHPAAEARAATIDSDAARSVVRWLAGGGLPDPEAGFTWAHRDRGRWVELGDGEPADFTTARLTPVLRAKPTGHPLIDEMLLRQPVDRTFPGDLIGLWSALLPSHREAASVHFLPQLPHGWWSRSALARELAGLVMADGPLGEATAVILAVLLAENAHDDVIPAVLRLAAKGELPAESIGRQMALAIRRTSWLETRPAIAALTELAEAGGHHEVWRMLRAMLPELLPREGQRITVVHAELVAFAADVARWTGARGEIPVIAEFAKSRRGARLIHECRRLHAQLTDTSP
ncbi:hypothetical protein [Herbidospora mongoliensis]|uniref:hypothetical protein n=1 Tax=Herbidospora mongoliensis TaxID=688067 RepID=UPI00083158F3|nr:hypothetical protein [Herbidospora mongoliensis]